MNTKREWTKYVLRILEDKEIDQIILNTNCQIKGARHKSKSLRKFNRKQKIAFLLNHKDIDRELVVQLRKLLNDDISKYNSYSVEQLVECKDEIEGLSRTTRLAVLMHFLGQSTTMPEECEAIRKTFMNDEDMENGSFMQENTANIQDDTPQENTTKVKETKSEKRNYKIMESLINELREKNAVLINENQDFKKQLLSQKDEYDTKIEELTNQLQSQLDELKEMRSVNETLTTKLNKNRKISLFIGSPFTKKKMEEIVQNNNIDNMKYLLVEQWVDGLRPLTDEISEVYALEFDLEWHVKDAIMEFYPAQVKTFRKYDALKEYIIEFGG
ncbi:MAG: hypothetical protein ATN36_00645 [Epulopiscium sp. Nele67-Bin005]|nr:MAG: hypothetical protein ATN36_00645 [Epulopiscium sp. Nele67-Bin005]